MKDELFCLKLFCLKGSLWSLKIDQQTASFEQNKKVRLKQLNKVFVINSFNCGKSYCVWFPSSWHSVRSGKKLTDLDCRQVSEVDAGGLLVLQNETWSSRAGKYLEILEKYPVFANTKTVPPNMFFILFPVGLRVTVLVYYTTVLNYIFCSYCIFGRAYPSQPICRNVPRSYSKLCSQRRGNI